MIPLSEKLRPRNLDEIVGQDHLTGTNGLIRKIINNKRPLSLLFYGPAGCGKTTLAKIYAQSFNLENITLSAIFTSITEIKKIITESKNSPLLSRQIIIFIDEIHRFNKTQQDVFLPFLEDGSIILIGATTENPSFNINQALLSRLRVLTLNNLDKESLNEILNKFEKTNKDITLTEKAKELLLKISHGDARFLLNSLETMSNIKSNKPIEPKDLIEVIQRKAPIYDNNKDQHFNLISAFHKSIRGSDPDAALYWLSRMLIGGEDPLYIIRRLIRISSEDIGLADTSVLSLCINTYQAYNILGSPEGELAIAQATIYLALCPKSNSSYLAFNKAKDLATKTHHLSPPTSIIKNIAYLNNNKDQESYIYDHDTKHCFSGQNYFPNELDRQSFYIPVERGMEREMKKRLNYFISLRSKLPSNE
jgi:putative ATPase